MTDRERFAESVKQGILTAPRLRTVVASMTEVERGCMFGVLLAGWEERGQLSHKVGQQIYEMLARNLHESEADDAGQEANPSKVE